MAINAQRDDDDIYYDPDTLPDYVENEPKYNQMYQQCKFYPKLNHDGVPVCYIFKNGNDKGHTMVADFFMEPLLHIQSDLDEEVHYRGTAHHARGGQFYGWRRKALD